MGWSFCPSHDKKTCIAEIRKDFASIGEVIKSTCVGNHLWCVVKLKSGVNVITLDLLENGGKESGWGHKGMDESVHPYYYSCPLAYLELAPVANEKWREGVRTYHARRSVKVEIGKVYNVTGGNWKTGGSKIGTVVVESLKPLVGLVDGLRCKLPRKLLADLTLAETALA